MCIVRGGIRCVSSFQCFLHAFFLSHSLTSLHTRTDSLLFGYPEGRARARAHAAPRTRRRDGRGYVFLALSLCPFESVLVLCCCSSPPFPFAIPHISRRMYMCMSLKRRASAPFPPPLPTRRRSIPVLPSCYRPITLQYVCPCTHAHMYIISALHLRTFVRFMRPPVSSPPLPPSLPCHSLHFSAEPALCFGFAVLFPPA
ncbi:hypothetical protein GSI_15556 [Ganoderma sinense ZZ0214-1]|uniref:Uncharacterized protein n=1 Tax=Ganoderma sinense ZZ0214-1 TaxID=1077348 RepID=A0A2G8RMY2_9APHY|nr:hypothetical protein GSI_15556 [Ganoderma sinense ZZ0214-1]